MGDPVELTYGQVALAASLILVNGAISLWLRLGLSRTLLWASLRATTQLLLVGLVLEWVFRLDRLEGVLVVASVMTLIAGVTANGRNGYRYPGIGWNTILSVWASGWLVAGFALLVVIRDESSWYRPQFAIPLLGMILGNTLNGITVGLNAFTESLYGQRAGVETRLALGASRREAALPLIRKSLRLGMMPIINSMLVVGIVSLPGMMTGQILSGTAPIEAVKYQIVILFLIASGTAVGTTTAVLLSYRRLFTRGHRFDSAKLVRSQDAGD